MSIKSTKKIIVTTIVAIMILAVTTPTFAAEKKGFNLTETLGAAKSFVNQAKEGIGKIDVEAIKGGITSSLGSFSQNSSKFDISSIFNNDSGEKLFSFNMPTVNENGKGSNILGNITNSITTGFGKIGDLFKPEEDESDDDKNPSGIKDLATLGKGIEFISCVIIKVLSSVFVHW